MKRFKKCNFVSWCFKIEILSPRSNLRPPRQGGELEMKGEEVSVLSLLIILLTFHLFESFLGGSLCVHCTGSEFKSNHCYQAQERVRSDTVLNVHKIFFI